MKNIEVKIAIIGGGAAGMVAAIAAATNVGGNQVCIIEKNKFLGRKLLATGNGRCNLTNTNCPNCQETLTFFEGLGVLHRVESEGRVYPYTEQATTVQQALIDEIKRLKVTCIYDSGAVQLKEHNNAFSLMVSEQCNGERWQIKAENALIATGGKAGLQYGSTGDGYACASSFGHGQVKPIPSLVQVTCKDTAFKELKGVRSKARVSLWCGGKTINSELGEVQFTQEGLSGICIFNLSRYIRFSEKVKSYEDFKIVVDFMPTFSIEDIKVRLSNDLDKNLKGMVNNKLLPVIMSKAKKMQGNEPLSYKVASILKGWQIELSGMKGWKEAQVTSGGVPLSEINLDSMESKIKKNLYFAGEVLDFDGKCGGYNLQWAWETGLLAGNSIK